MNAARVGGGLAEPDRFGLQLDFPTPRRRIQTRLRALDATSQEGRPSGRSSVFMEAADRRNKCRPLTPKASPYGSGARLGNMSNTGVFYGRIRFPLPGRSGMLSGEAPPFKEGLGVVFCMFGGQPPLQAGREERTDAPLTVSPDNKKAGS